MSPKVKYSTVLVCSYHTFNIRYQITSTENILTDKEDCIAGEVINKTPLQIEAIVRCPHFLSTYLCYGVILCLIY